MFELVNTSLPNGLLPGTHGFATVAMTRGLADNLRRRLEDLSAYVHKTSAHDATYDTLNPIAWSHLILPRGEHILGRVAAAPFDYTGRTNRLARLVCLSAAETKAINAAETLLRENSYFSAPWEGEARWLEPDAALATRFGAPSSRASRKAQAWIDAFGEADGSRYVAGFAALLRDTIRKNGKPLVFITSQQSDPDGRRALAFIADLIALLPEGLRTSATFSTYPCAIPIGVKCAIRVLRKDDNGYAQAVAGVPVADFAEKAVQNATLLPRDVELEHLAATGNLPALTATAEVSPQSAASQPSVTIKAAADEAIDVSIDIPPATESDETIAVTEKDASHRTPKLKHRPGQSTNMPVQGRRFDPIFGQPSKRSKGPLIAAIAACAILVLGLGTFVVLQSKSQGSISGGDASVQTAQDAEREKIREQFERERQEALRKEKEEQERRQAEAEAAKAKSQEAERERLARAKAEKEAKSTATEGVRSGKAEPLFSNVREIVVCANDDEARGRFGNPGKNGLSAGVVWYYADDLKDYHFTDSAGRGGNWDTLMTDDSRYELKTKGLPAEKDTRYCRLWRFDRKPETLYWVTGNARGDEFELQPPHLDTTVNLAERLTGPDLRVLAQWTAVFGRVSCQAWSAEGTNRVEWLEVDAAAFVPSAFIAKCHALRLATLNRELEATSNEWQRAIQSKTEDLKKLEVQITELEGSKGRIAAAKEKLKPVETKMNDAIKAYDTAKKAFDDAEKAYDEANRNADAKIKGLEKDLRTLRIRRDAESKSEDKKKHDPEIQAKEKELETARNEVPEKRNVRNEAKIKYDDAERELNAAKARYEAKRIELKIEQMEKELETLKQRKKRITDGPTELNAKVTDLRTEIAKFPTVAEAQKDWTIHVKVDLGEGK